MSQQTLALVAAAAAVAAVVPLAGSFAAPSKPPEDVVVQNTPANPLA